MRSHRLRALTRHHRRGGDRRDGERAEDEENAEEKPAEAEPMDVEFNPESVEVPEVTVKKTKSVT